MVSVGRRDSIKLLMALIGARIARRSPVEEENLPEPHGKTFESFVFWNGWVLRSDDMAVNQ